MAWIGIQIVVSLALVAVGLVNARSGRPYQFADLNFVASRTFNGRSEIRVAQNGILGMEARVKGNKNSIFFRMATDGEKIVKLIYSDDETIEMCKDNRLDSADLKLFLAKFTGKETYASNDLLIENLLTHLNKDSKDCKSEIVNPDKELHPSYQKLIDIDSLVDKCHNKESSTKHLLEEYHKQHKSKTENGYVSAHVQSREKRESGFIYPGTKWCGKGSTSVNYDDLGDAREEDMCCREHDSCKFMIEGMTRKFGLFNPRLTTISHCDCDDRFIHCLKMKNTIVADMIGDLYFNVGRTACFVFEQQRKCVERSWFGLCREYAYVQTTVEKEAMPYVN